jgi:hypothetical protein
MFAIDDIAEGHISSPVLEELGGERRSAGVHDGGAQLGEG